MDSKLCTKWIRGGLGLVVLGAAFGASGCLLVVAGAVSQNSYTFESGELHAEAKAELGSVWQAATTALDDLGLPRDYGFRGDRTARLLSRTDDNRQIHIHLENRPASGGGKRGPITEIRIRVGVSGDEKFSRRILRRIRAEFPVETSSFSF